VVESAIERLAAGGDGVGRTSDGRALFVPFTAPGDRVRVRLLEQRPRYARGSLEALLEPGPERTKPRCPVFGVCGGCSWQHLGYPLQVRAKADILRDSLVRIGGFELSEPPPMTRSPRPYAYRNRTRVLMAGGRVGYRRRRSHEICAVDRCPVLEPALERALARMSRRASTAVPGRPAPAGILALGPVEPGAPRGRDDDGAEWELVLGADDAVRTAPLSGSAEQAPKLVLRCSGERIAISPGVFAQGNAYLLDALASGVVRAACRTYPGTGGGAPAVLASSLVELFSGAGLLTLPLARRFDRVVAMESHPAAVCDLRFNLRTAGLKGIEVIHTRVERGLRTLRGERPDVVVLDPPRTGLASSAAEDLAALAAPRIVYLSCDPATLARDAAKLRLSGYQLVHVEGFDLFPQTPHVEALAVLERPR
jgi:23S rRNA (uracil1939-C5)-methyltransferase